MIHLTHSCESKSINDDADNEQPADKVQGGGGKRPLGEKLPNGFLVPVENTTHPVGGKLHTILNLTGAIELHRVVIKDGYDQLEKQKDEITSKIIDSTCTSDYHNFKEVSQPPLPLLPRSRHCSSLVGSELIQPLKQRPYS